MWSTCSLFTITIVDGALPKVLDRDNDFMKKD